MRYTLVVLVLVLVGAACGDVVNVDISIDQDKLKDRVSGWVEDFGTENSDPEVWAGRVERACGEGAWDLSKAKDLAKEFISEDMGDTASSGEVSPSKVDQAADALRQMAEDACPEKFGDG